ncbi:MAG: glycerol-3-phosphate acyltransferase, partial [Synergistaceae bacterium]|nr:glycerol-3-phosphate acyltransferase [Synergistaceae bacterium]
MGFGYLMGSCPTGYVLVKLILGEDIRKFGSGNIGATNVSRVLGRKWAVLTAVCDMFKGG